jgi:hypothetical protein
VNGTLLRLGLILLAVSLVMIFLSLASPVAARYFRWFGRLPGDIAIDREGLTIRIPLASSIVISVILTVVVNALLRWR